MRCMASEMIAIECVQMPANNSAAMKRKEMTITMMSLLQLSELSY